MTQQDEQSRVVDTLPEVDECYSKLTMPAGIRRLIQSPSACVVPNVPSDNSPVVQEERMKISRASIFGAVFVALAVLAAGCAASDEDRQAAEASPSTDSPTLEATTASAPEDSPPSVGPELEPNAVAETAPSPTARASEAVQEPTLSSTAEAGDIDPNNALPVAGQGGSLLQNTRDVEVDLTKHRQLLFRDAIPPIYDPEFTSAKDAGLDLEELVIGVKINGDIRAYPIGPLVQREMVNDVVGGVPILVTW